MERKFKRNVASLEHIVSFIDEVVTRHGLAAEVVFELQLAIEEIFTNMVKYSTESRHDIGVGLEFQNRDVIVSITDFDVDAFDPTAAEPDIQERLDTRATGGRGLFLVRQVMDSIHYTYNDRTSKITMVKSLETKRA